jgi:hypothetical protein
MRHMTVAALVLVALGGWLFYGLAIDFERCPGKDYCWQRPAAGGGNSHG